MQIKYTNPTLHISSDVKLKLLTYLTKYGKLDLHTGRNARNQCVNLIYIILVIER